MGRRKSVMLDEEHAARLRELAYKHGTTVANYLRSLIEALWEAEEKGVNAIAALRRAVIFEVLTRLGVFPTPLELLACSDPLEAGRLGERVGASLAALVDDVAEFIASTVERFGLGVAEYNRVLLLPQHEKSRVVASEFIKGVARASGYEVREEGELTIIELKHHRRVEVQQCTRQKGGTNSCQRVLPGAASKARGRSS